MVRWDARWLIRDEGVDMTATKQCPSCGKQWPADAPFCGYCATSLHNVIPRGDSAHSEASTVVQRGVDDEYISMFRAPQAPDGIAVAHLRRVDDGVLWAHVQRLTVVIWMRYVMTAVCGLLAVYALVSLVQLGDRIAWTGWHLVGGASIMCGCYLFSSALVVQAQRDMVVRQLAPPSVIQK